MSEWRGDNAADGASGASDASDADGSGGNQNRGFNKVEVKRINYDTLQTSLPEAQMRGKQVGLRSLCNGDQNVTATIM